MASLVGKIALITGASSGIGAATAMLFAERGATLALCGRSKTRLEEVAKKCANAGLAKDKIHMVTGDMMKEEDIASVYENVMGKFGALDILVLNAGSGCLGMAEDLTLSQMDDMYKLFIRGIFQMSKLALPQLKARKGCIVNVSAGSSQRVALGTCCYNICKAGMDLLTKQLSVEFGPYGIRVNAVNPGGTKTGIFMTNGVVSNKEEEEALIKQGGLNVPLGRYAEPSEIASAIAFLASSEASYISGVCLLVDGGEFNTPPGPLEIGAPEENSTM